MTAATKTFDTPREAIAYALENGVETLVASDGEHQIRINTQTTAIECDGCCSLRSERDEAREKLRAVTAAVNRYVHGQQDEMDDTAWIAMVDAALALADPGDGLREQAGIPLSPLEID